MKQKRNDDIGKVCQNNDRFSVAFGFVLSSIESNQTPQDSDTIGTVKYFEIQIFLTLREP